MKQERLELYKALAKTRVYEERRGEWLVGDYVFDSDHGFGFGYLGAVGKCSFGVNFTNGQHCGYSANTLGEAGSMLLWLPPVYDIERPERSLWGMVGWEKITQPPLMADNGDMAIAGITGLNFLSLDIALIKAILVQDEG